MSALKIAMIGGGSVVWTPHLATDLFLTEELKGSTLVLVDINPDSAQLMQKYCTMLADRQGTGWKVTVATEDEALDKADVVCVAISTGGFNAMHHDVTIPQKYGVFHAVGDTTGPGGISRTLRNVPIFVNLARKMEKLCPKAWMVHVTNPLAQITRSVNKATSIRCLGLCHNYLGTRAFFANFFKCKREEVLATSVGVNHFSWLKNLTCKGQDMSHMMSLENYLKYEAAKPKTSTGSIEDTQPDKWQAIRFYLNFELYEQTGIFPVGASSHVAENFPHYLGSTEAAKKHFIHRKGVLPERADSQAKARTKVIDRVEGRQPLPEIEDSIEQLAPVVAALCAGKSTRTVVNVPNVGQITNLPLGAVVETWAHVDWDTVTPEFSGEVPSPVAGWVQQIVQEEELAVKAALTGCRKTFIQALLASPMLTDKDAATALADELLAANAAHLPQFKSGSSKSRSASPALQKA